MTRGSLSWRPLIAYLGMAALTTAAVPVTVRAQQPAPLPIAPGTRVRVTATNLVAPLVANFLQMRGDTAVFIEDAAGRGIWSLVVSDITRLERSDGERLSNRPYVVRGAMLGAGAGSVVGWVFAATFSPSDSTKKFSRPLNASIGAVVGAVVGGFIGSRRATERWTDITLPRRVSVVPQRRGVALSLSLTF